jgi:hypothetical protein
MRTAIPAAPCCPVRMRIFQSVGNVRPAFVPAWAPGDPADVLGDRVMHRGMVAG